jgi:hypothetical protein
VEFNQTNSLPPSVRTMQIIVAGLTMGPVIFLAIVCFVAPAINIGPAFGGLPMLTMIGFGIIAFQLVARAIVLRAAVSKARRDIIRRAPAAGDGVAAELMAIYQTRMIISAAILEGSGFFLIIAYMLERSPYALAAAVVLILAVAAHFPTRQRVDDFVEEQTAKLREERQFESI